MDVLIAILVIGLMTYGGCCIAVRSIDGYWPVPDSLRKKVTGKRRLLLDEEDWEDCLQDNWDARQLYRELKKIYESDIDRPAADAIEMIIDDHLIPATKLLKEGGQHSEFKKQLDLINENVSTMAQAHAGLALARQKKLTSHLASVNAGVYRPAISANEMRSIND